MSQVPLPSPLSSQAGDRQLLRITVVFALGQRGPAMLQVRTTWGVLMSRPLPDTQAESGRSLLLAESISTKQLDALASQQGVFLKGKWCRPFHHLLGNRWWKECC